MQFLPVIRSLAGDGTQTSRTLPHCREHDTFFLSMYFSPSVL